MKPLIKNTICMALLLAVFSGLCAPAFASSQFTDSYVSDEEVIYVDDGSGNIVAVTITERTYAKHGGRYRLMASSSPQVRDVKTISVKISNTVLGAPSAVGSVLSAAAKKTLAKTAANAIAAKLGANFLPGVNLVSTILGSVAFINACFGNNGFEVTVVQEYCETYMHKEGYYIRGWSPKSVSLSTY